MYNQYDIQHITQDMLNNKLFCSFSTEEDINTTIYEIQSLYNILYNKMFVLKCDEDNLYAITYNIDNVNVSYIKSHIISMHRKKEFNTLYTINALNALIKQENEGHTNHSYQVNWSNYKNSILLTQHNELKQFNTKIYKIITC
jgi:hypothetical protein